MMCVFNHATSRLNQDDMLGAAMRTQLRMQQLSADINGISGSESIQVTAAKVSSATVRLIDTKDGSGTLALYGKEGQLVGSHIRISKKQIQELESAEVQGKMAQIEALNAIAEEAFWQMAEIGTLGSIN